MYKALLVIRALHRAYLLTSQDNHNQGAVRRKVLGLNTYGNALPLLRAL